MAKSPFNTNRGSVGGTVTQGGRFGPIQRERVKPINPQTERQQTQRNIFATVASEWRGLTELQRNGWDALAAQVGGNLTGSQLYTRVNSTRVTCGQAKLEDAPALPAFGILTIGALVADNSAQTVILNNVAVTVVPDKFMVFAAAPVSAGIRNRNAAFRLIKTINGAAGPANIDMSAEYLAKFGAIAEGQRIAVLIKQIKDGFAGVPFKAETLVVA